MATVVTRNNTFYGYPNPQGSQFPSPIVAARTPTTADRAQVGQIWVYSTGNNAYLLTSINGGISTWITLSLGGGGIFASLVVNGNSTFDGNITQTAGVTSLLQTTINGSLTQNGGDTLLNTDAGNRTISIGSGAGIKTVTLGSTNTTSTTTINSGSGNINLNGTTVISKAGTVLQTNCTAGGAVSLQSVQTSNDNAGVLFNSLKRRTGGTISINDYLLTFGIFGQEAGVDITGATIDSVAVDVAAGRVSGDLGFNTRNLAGVEARRLVISTEGQVSITTAGQTLAVTGGGATPFIGNDQLAAGTKAVACSAIALNDRVFITVETPTNAGLLSVAVNAGVGFTVTSANAADTSTFNYFVVRQI